jgi:hypothetical protein
MRQQMALLWPMFIEFYNESGAILKFEILKKMALVRLEIFAFALSVIIVIS